MGRPRLNIKIGQQFRTRVVLQILSRRIKNKSCGQYALVRCSCGDQRWLSVSYLASSAHTACKMCHFEKRIKIGCRIGARTVVATKLKTVYIKTRPKGRQTRYVKLRCVCGGHQWLRLAEINREILSGRGRICRYCAAKAQRIKINLGQRFGTRIVIATRMKRQWAQNNSNQQALMQCDCSRKDWVSAEALVSGKSRTCKRCRRLKTFIGERIGSRTVIKIKMKQSLQKVLMCCDCGQTNWTDLCSIKTSHQGADACASCVSIKVVNKRNHPKLTKEELQTLLDLKIYKKKTLASLNPKGKPNVKKANKKR